MSNTVTKIWKQTLIQGRNEIFMPEGSIPISIAIQHFQPTVWFMVPTDDDGRVSSKKERFLIYGHETGKQCRIRDSDIFLGTLLTKDDSYVVHYFWLGGRGYSVS